MSSSCRKLYFALGAGALLGLTGVGAHADNWEFLPRIEGGGLFNDNYRLADTPADQLQVYGPYIDAQLSANLLSPTSKLDIVPRVHATLFPTDHADQSTDGYLDIDGEHKTLRSDFTGVAQYANETVIYSVLLPATFPGVALGQPETGQTGRISVSNRRQLARVRPKYQYDLTQRTHLQLNADLEHESFTQGSAQVSSKRGAAAAVPQVGYTSYMGGAGIGFDVSPRSVFTVSGIGSRFVPQTGGNDTNNYGVQLEWDLRRSQIAQFYARLAAERTEAQTAVGTVSTNGITGGVGVDLRYQITEITIDALRALTPSAEGAVVEDDEVRFRILHAFEPRLSGFLGARGMRLHGTSGQTALTVQTQNYAAVEAGLDYQITQNYRLEGAYDFNWLQFPGTPTATSNAVRLAIIYQPLSRYEPLPQLNGIPKER